MPQRRQMISAFVLALLLSSIFWVSVVSAESEVLIQKTGSVTVQKTIADGFQNQVDEITVSYTFYPNGSLLVWNTLGEEFFFQAPKFQPNFEPVVTLWQNSTQVAQHFWVNGSQTNAQGKTETEWLDLWVYFRFIAHNAKITLAGTTNDTDSEVEYEFQNPKSANIASNTTAYTIGGITFDWSDLQGTTSFEFALNKLKVKFAASFNLDPTIVSSVGYYSATVSPSQRKLLYANGYWHAFYCSSSKLYHRSSADGGTWSSATLISSDCYSGQYVSVWGNDTNGYIVNGQRSSNYPLKYFYGSFTSGGAFSIIASGDLIGYFSTCSDNVQIAADSAGLPYVFFYNYSADAFQVTKSSSATTWTTAVSYPQNLSSTTTYVAAVSLVPLTNQKMLAIYGQDSIEHYRSRYYNGSGWEAVDTVSTTHYDTASSGSQSLVAINDTAYFAYCTAAYHIKILKWNATSGWSSLTTITDRDSGYFSLSTAGSKLYAFTTDTNKYTINWRTYTPSTNAWGTDASMSDYDPQKMYSITSLYQRNSAKETAFLYTSRSPSYVKFRKITTEDPPETYEEENPPSSSETTTTSETGTTLTTTNQTAITLPFVLPRLGTYGIFLGVGLMVLGAVMYAFRGSGSTRRRSKTASYAHRVQPAPRSSQYHPPPKPKRRYA